MALLVYAIAIPFFRVEEQAEDRLGRPLLPLRRDGTARLRDRHRVFPRRLHVIAADGRYPGRANVGTALLDHPALGRDLSRRSADGSGDGRMVPRARIPTVSG